MRADFIIDPGEPGADPQSLMKAASKAAFTIMTTSILRALQSCLLLCCMTFPAASAERIVFRMTLMASTA